ncbi:MAG: PD-(D/E)XK nuclease family protein [Actinomycetia bacterium]|jgi:putative RecB family exonuclease|nr:PD-(D/E)XK nuclease family protein [Actinomycetes bacterium]
MPDTPPPAAAPAVVGSLSPSRAGDFMACPLLYRFRVIDQFPEAPSAAATRGTVVHAVLERLFDLPAPERTLDAALELVGPQWQALLEAEPELAALLDGEAAGSGPDGDLPAFLADATDLLRRYFALEDPTRLEPAERELHVTTVLESGLALRGYLDRLDVAPSGDLRVVDYKTGKAPPPGFEGKAMFQMRFYALVLWRLRGRVPRQLQLLYLGNGERLHYEPDEADLLATERKVHALWRAISAATERGDFRPNPSRLCEWCDHRQRCPAQGGVLPPLPAGPLPLGVDADTDELPSPSSPLDEV